MAPAQTLTVQQKLDEDIGRILVFLRILEWSNIRLRQGEESSLNDKLEQLRTLDRQGWMHI